MIDSSVALLVGARPDVRQVLDQLEALDLFEPDQILDIRLNAA